MPQFGGPLTGFPQRCTVQQSRFGCFHIFLGPMGVVVRECFGAGVDEPSPLHFPPKRQAFIISAAVTFLSTAFQVLRDREILRKDLFQSDADNVQGHGGADASVRLRTPFHRPAGQGRDNAPEIGDAGSDGLSSVQQHRRQFGGGIQVFISRNGKTRAHAAFLSAIALSRAAKAISSTRFFSTSGIRIFLLFGADACFLFRDLASDLDGRKGSAS